jgi:hypothetical protein
MRKCPWCADESTDWEPLDSTEALARLCRPHVAEYEGVSLDGLDRMEADERADMANLGYFDR